MDILLDGQSGQSLLNDNYGAENVPSSLLNALLPDTETQNTVKICHESLQFYINKNNPFFKNRTS